MNGHRRSRVVVLFVGAALFATGGLALPGRADRNRASATIYDASGAEVGSVKLNGESAGVRVRVQATAFRLASTVSTSTPWISVRRRTRRQGATGIRRASPTRLMQATSRCS
jgi:hypothetical protein